MHYTQRAEIEKDLIYIQEVLNALIYQYGLFVGPDDEIANFIKRMAVEAQFKLKKTIDKICD